MLPQSSSTSHTQQRADLALIGSGELVSLSVAKGDTRVATQVLQYNVVGFSKAACKRESVDHHTNKGGSRILE